MSNSSTTTAPTTKFVHHPLCKVHDGGSFDSVCNGNRWDLSPVWNPAADPGRVWVQEYRYASRNDEAQPWDQKPPLVELSVQGADDMMSAELTPGEARQVAAALLNAAEQAELDSDCRDGDPMSIRAVMPSAAATAALRPDRAEIALSCPPWCTTAHRIEPDDIDSTGATHFLHRCLLAADGPTGDEEAELTQAVLVAPDGSVVESPVEVIVGRQWDHPYRVERVAALATAFGAAVALIGGAR